MRLLLALCLSLGACAPLDGVPPPKLVLIGEIHDNPDHHAVQAAYAQDNPVTAIVFEMLSRDGAATVNRLRDTGAAREEIATALAWDKSGWPDLGFYAAIWEAAPLAPVYGAELPRSALRGLMGGDADPQMSAKLAALPPLPAAEQAALEAEMQASHCNALPVEALPVMASVQRLRDAMLAEAALQALRETGGPVLVIAGNGHVRKDRGVPSLLGLGASEVLVIGQGESAAADAPYDRWLSAPARDRPDPCLAFRKG